MGVLVLLTIRYAVQSTIRSIDSVFFTHLITSLTFMLVCVPEPVWNTTRGKWSDGGRMEQRGERARERGIGVVLFVRADGVRGRYHIQQPGFWYISMTRVNR